MGLGLWLLWVLQASASERVTEATAWVHLSQRGVEEVRPCTGFLISGNRLLTCEHCVVDAEDCRALRAEFTRSGGESMAYARCRRLIATDRIRDVALVQLEVLEGALPAALALTRHPVTPGRKVEVVGYPVYAGRQRTRTEGRTLPPPNAYAGDQYHDAITGPGNSGSPVVDALTEEVLSMHCAGSRLAGRRVGYGAPASVLRALAK